MLLFMADLKRSSHYWNPHTLDAECTVHLLLDVQGMSQYYQTYLELLPDVSHPIQTSSLYYHHCPFHPSLLHSPPFWFYLPRRNGRVETDRKIFIGKPIKWHPTTRTPRIPMSRFCTEANKQIKISWTTIYIFLVPLCFF